MESAKPRFASTFFARVPPYAAYLATKGNPMMSEFFDTEAVRDEPAHWDALARRVAENATRSSRRGAFEWVAQSRAGWIAASLVCGLSVVSLAALSRSSSAASRAAEWARLITPTDNVGRAISMSNTPPAIGTLLLPPGQ